MNDLTAHNWEEALAALYDDSWNRGIGRFRSSFVFRGVSRASFRLETSLIRLCANNPVKIPLLERLLLRTFKKYAHRDVASRDFDWYWLAVAQHHRLATRLLDWTSSPLVALHFATTEREHYDADGAVWMIDVGQAHGYLPPKLASTLENNAAYVFDTAMLSSTVESLGHLDSYPDQQSSDGFVLFYEPPSLDDRIVNQYALFSMMSDPTAVLDDWLVARPHLYRKLIIPANVKWEIRDKLDQSNLTERVIYPGLDGLSMWLNRYYYPMK